MVKDYKVITQKIRTVITGKLKYEPNIDGIIKIKNQPLSMLTLVLFRALFVGSQKVVKMNLEPQVRQ